MDFLNLPQRYPRAYKTVSVMAAVVFTFQTIWALFSSNPPIPAIADWLIARHIVISPLWMLLTGPITIGLVVWVVISPFVNSPAIPQTTTPEQTTLPTQPQESEYVPLKDASIVVYDVIRQIGGLWQGFAEGEASSAYTPEEAQGKIISFVCTLISSHVPIYGRSPPSTLVMEADIRGRTGAFTDMGNEWHEYLSRKPGYSDLQIKRSDLDIVINHLREFPDGEPPTLRRS